MTVLFRAAAGPRIGFGHLVRSAVLRRSLRVPGSLSLRGARSARRVAKRMGWRRVTASTPAQLRAERVDLLVIDDPSATAAHPWVRAARRRGIPVASVHDLGLAPVSSDLFIDGSIISRACTARMCTKRSYPQCKPGLGAAACAAAQTSNEASRASFVGLRRSFVTAKAKSAGSVSLRGPRYAVIDRRYARARWRPTRRNPTVLIALGGGPHARLAGALAAALLERDRRIRVRIASGLGGVAASRPALVASAFRRKAGGRIFRLKPEATKDMPEATKRARKIFRLKPEATKRVAWIGPRRSLARELASCNAAIVGGGVTLYEACALGTPTVAVPVVRAQAPTVEAFTRVGAALRGGNGFGRMPEIDPTVEMVIRALRPREQQRLSRASRSLIDGRGARRVAAALRRLAISKHSRGIWVRAQTKLKLGPTTLKSGPTSPAMRAA